MTEHAVVIVGGGPTGLMLAGELGLAGINVAIVERRIHQDLSGSRARNDRRAGAGAGPGAGPDRQRSAPSVRPSTTFRCAIIATISTGITAISDPAISRL
jgi:glycine/D-amino acid oxidase-like deaminating enzyme